MVASRNAHSARSAVVMTLAATCAGFAAMALPRVAQACGPFFSPSLFESRGEALVGVGRGRIELDYPKLATTTLKRCSPIVMPSADESCPRKMPAAPDTVDGRLYAIAAAALQAHADDKAKAAFTAILQLPPTQRPSYSVAAAFMLGKLAAPHGASFFEQARSLANDGFADPLCLAVESLGEQGRQALARGDDGKAVQAYAEQAAAGDEGAVASLDIVGKDLAADPRRLVRALQMPVVQALMASMAHANGTSWAADGDDWADRDEASTHPIQLLWAMASVPLERGQDRLAASAWRAGEYELAEHFAGQSDRALAQVVRAKAALRHGETAQLRERLDAAARAAAAEDDLRLIGQIEQDRAVLALSERRYEDAGAIAVALGDVVLAVYIVERVLAPGEAGAFLARKDVQTNLARRAPDETGAMAASFEGNDEGSTADDSDSEDADSSDKAAPTRPRLRPTQLERAIQSLHGDTSWDRPTLRQLTEVLARRLVREGHGAEAARMLPAAEAERARRYAKAMSDAERTQGIDRAEALYRAARALLPDGMSLIGTELGPDWTIVEGSYEDAFDTFTRQLPKVLFRPVEHANDPTCQTSLEVVSQSARVCVVSADEARRVAASAPPGISAGYRYHYRARAAELLLRAAESVPTHTQAYAALLCASWRPVRDRVPDWPISPYSLYARQGAFVPGVFDSDRPCPEPQFERARHTPAPSWQWRVQRRLRWLVRDGLSAADTGWQGAQVIAQLRWVEGVGEAIVERIPYGWRSAFGED